MNYVERFRVKPGDIVKLKDIDASFKDKHESHDHALPEIEAYSQRLREFQFLMYAESKHFLLICLQGRDAAGKDGTINHVLAAMNPQGCTVSGFKVPTRGGGPRLPLALSQGRAITEGGGRFQPVSLRGRAGRSRARLGG